MRFIDIPNIPRNHSIRRLHPCDSTLAVLIGDDRNTHSVHWLSLDDDSETLRRAVPVFPDAPDPALSPDLAMLAFAEPGALPRFVVELPHEPERGRRFADSPPSPWEAPTRICGCLGISLNGRMLRASYDDGDLVTFAIEGFSKAPPASGAAPLRIVQYISETVPPATVLVHGSDEAFLETTGRPAPVDLYFMAGNGTVGDFIVSDCEPHVFDAQYGTARMGAFGPDGRRFGIAFGNQVIVWELTGWRPTQRVALAHEAAVTALAFSPDGTTIATACEDGRVHFWDAESGAWESERALSIGRLGGVAFSTDGQGCIAGGERGRIAVWNLEEAETDATPPEPEESAPPPDSSPANSTFQQPSEVAAPSEDAHWVAIHGLHLPANALVVGHEADGAPLYAARVAHRGGLYLGKFRPGFGGANVGYRRREISLLPFEVLAGSSATWAPASGGEIPACAMACGHDDKGNPFYLARGMIGEGLHTGRIAEGMNAARLPFGGVEVEVAEYQVLLGAVEDEAEEIAEQEEAEEAGEEVNAPIGEPLLFWDFENVMSVGNVSTAAGVSSEPKAISGFVSQTGGGPAEQWGETGTVFLTRHFGTCDVFLWFTITRPMMLDGLTFRHWHNPGYPTCPSYKVQLLLDDGEEFEVGEPLTLSNETSGRTDTIAIERQLAPGSYKIRWRPQGLRKSRDTSSEFFALKGLRLEGRFSARMKGEG